MLPLALIPSSATVHIGISCLVICGIWASIYSVILLITSSVCEPGEALLPPTQLGRHLVYLLSMETQLGINSVSTYLSILLLVLQAVNCRVVFKGQVLRVPCVHFVERVSWATAFQEKKRRCFLLFYDIIF